jgi:hypothetical protein
MAFMAAVIVNIAAIAHFTQTEQRVSELLSPSAAELGPQRRQELRVWDRKMRLRWP